jgi:anti-sigma factor RsiW
MKHDDTVLLHAGLDGELDVERSLELQARLARDPAFKAMWESQQTLRNAIRERGEYHAAPASLSGRLAAALAAERVDERVAEPGAAPTARTSIPTERTRRGWLVAAGSAVAASVLTGAVLVRLQRDHWGRGDPLSPHAAEEAVAAHTRAMMAGQTIEVASADQHTVRPWLSARLSFAPKVPDLSLQGFELVGGRRDVIGGQTVAALVYRRRQHIVCAFIQPHDAEAPRQVHVVRGFNVITMAHAGMAYVIVSDLNANELGDFADLQRGAS